MAKSANEKRRHQRFNTGVEVIFQVAYNLKTKVNFQKIDKDTQQVLNRKYSALSKNVSAEGLCFTCGQKLEKGDLLQIEIVSRARKGTVGMQGEVRWSEANSEGENKYDTGLVIHQVNGKEVSSTFHRDSGNNIVWSDVLQTVIGDFKE